jgi:hypothetical protein
VYAILKPARMSPYEASNSIVAARITSSQTRIALGNHTQPHASLAITAERLSQALFSILLSESATHNELAKPAKQEVKVPSYLGEGNKRGLD